MKYSCTKFTVFIGLVLLTVVILQNFVGILPEHQSDVDVKKTLVNTLQYKLCSGDLPKPVASVLDTIDIDKQTISQALPIVIGASLSLGLIFTFISPKGCFSWVIIRFLGLFFFMALFMSSAIYLVGNFNPSVCSTAKGIMVGAVSYESFPLPKFDFKLEQIPKYDMAISYLPNVEKYIATYKSVIGKLGIFTPAFLLVLGLLLLSKETRCFTRHRIILLVSLIISIISGIHFYGETSNVALALGYSSAFFILGYIIANTLICLSSFILFPVYLFGIVSIVIRVLEVTSMIPLPICLCMFTGIIFVFFFNLVMLLCRNGPLMLSSFLLYNAISLIYPGKLTYDLIVVIFLLFQCSGCDCCSKCSNGKCNKQEKVKTE